MNCFSGAPKEKTAVVLSGGGAYGAYEIGVLKALFNGLSPVNGFKPLDVGIFTGTSVGAFNAAVMTMQPGRSCAQTIDLLEKLWLDKIAATPGSCGNGVLRIRANPMEYLQPGCAIGQPFNTLANVATDAMVLMDTFFSKANELTGGTSSLSHRVLGLVDISAFVSTEPFRQLLEASVDFAGIRANSTILRVIASNLKTGLAATFTNSEMTDAEGALRILASASLPGVFPPVEIGDDVFIDGGAVANTPLNFALEAGATELHVIYLDPPVSVIPFEDFSNTLDIFERVFMIINATITNEDIKTAQWINDGLDVLEKLSANPNQAASDSDVKKFLRVVSKIDQKMKAGQPYSKITIHRYHPKAQLGGLTAILDFDRAPIEKLIERGFHNAVRHDCQTEGCVVHS